MIDDEEEEAPPVARRAKKKRPARSAPPPPPPPPRVRRNRFRWMVPVFGVLPWFLAKLFAPYQRPDEEEALPAFARAFPRDPDLDALVAAFEAGDYARVRREAPALAKRTDDDAVRRAARQLRRRLDPDPAAVYMLMAAAALLVFLAGWYWLHPHPS